jgi:hypothetical protein
MWVELVSALALKACQPSLLNRQTIFTYLHLKLGAAADAEG